MHVKARVTTQPAIARGAFVGLVVAGDQMRVWIARVLAVARGKKVQEFLVAVAHRAPADHPAVGTSGIVDSVDLPRRV